MQHRISTNEAGPESPSSEGALVEYRRRKLELAELIRSLMSVAAERDDDEKRAAAREVLARLADDAFQLAVVGQFSRGKSTLMNAILGNPYLPAGSLPMTSVVTRVSYGSAPRVLIERAGSSFPIETTLDQLERFVAQASREREKRRVVSAHVELPAEILRLGYVFVDTPGVGSAIPANTATTEAFLPEADAVIFVTSFDAPLSEAEMTFLAKVRDQVSKVFVVVNKLDLVTATEARNVLAYVREQLADSYRSSEVRVFATSARQALQARLDDDPASLAESGLAELQQTLIRFLAGEKSRVFLQRVAVRADVLARRQRIDLELARIAQADGPELTAQRKQFERGTIDLLGRVRAAGAALGERIADTLSSELAERSQTWPHELQLLLLGSDLEKRLTDSPGQKAKAQLQAARTSLLESKRTTVDGWLRERITETESLIHQLAADEIATLRALQESVGDIGAKAFGLSAVEDTAPTPTWSPTDLPQLAVRPATFDIPLELPWITSITRGNAHDRLARLSAAVKHGIDDYCDATRNALDEAAHSWTELVADNVESETRRAADRIRERLQTPDSEWHLQHLEELEQRLTAFRVALNDWHPESPLTEAAIDSGLRTTPPKSAPCIICDRIRQVPFDYIADAQYDLGTHENARVAYANGGGFCALHAWQYAQTASFLGIALTYAELADSASEQLKAAATTATNNVALGDAVERYLVETDRCPVCLAIADAQKAAIAEFSDELQGQARDGAVAALCIPHLAAILTDQPDLDQNRLLVRAVADVLGRTADDLRTYALKRDSLRRHLLNDEERYAYHQAVVHLAGDRSLARPWRIDDRI